MSDPLKPLLNDPKRDATPTLRGFSYQILRTIEAWLDLREGEILIVEGAEDLDRVGSAGAVVEQVKDTAGSGSVTLRSKGVLEAVSNLLAHQDRNTGTSIEFRFLTTSPIGREQGDPMGLGRPGLEAWASVRRDPTGVESRVAAEAIRTFIGTQPYLGAAGKKWVAAAGTDEFVKRCIEPIEWITGQGNIAELTDRLEARLVELGERRGLSASDSLKALDALHRHVWAVATDSSRKPLRRGNLLTIVDEAGRTSLPTADLARLIGMITSGAGSTDLAITPTSAIEHAPRRAPRHLARPALEEALKERLSHGIISIHGGTGMGKSDLAIGIASKSAQVGWVNMREGDTAATVAKLRAVELAVRTEGRPIRLVLDDLDTGDDPRPFEQTLMALSDTLQATGSDAVVTSAKPLPPRLSAALKIGSANTVQAPGFDLEEVERHLRDLGCPEDLMGSWGKLIRATSGGHPQLVHARTEALAVAGFPRPSYDDFLTRPQDVVDVEAEARRIVSTLPAGQRELLCRASLLTGRQPRERLLRVARIGPEIQDPGDVVDRLAGPWLELVDGSELRASPLLRDLGTKARGEEWARDMHAGIANAYVAGRTLPATDISSILMHCLIGRTAAPLVRIMPSLLQAPANVWEQIGETAGMFAHVGVGDGVASPFDRPTDLAAFRILQFRIAAEKDELAANAVLDRALQESVGAGEDVDFFTMLLLWQVAQSEDLKIDPVTRIQHAIRFARLGERIEAALPARMAAAGIEEVDGDWPEAGTLGAIGALTAIRDLESLDAVLDALNDADPADARLLMRGFDERPEFAAIAMTRIWLAESYREIPRWEQVASSLNRAAILAAGMDATTFATAAGALLVRTIDENVGDASAAEAAANGLPAEVALTPAVMAAKAKVLWRGGRDIEALSLYDEALPRFDPGDPAIVDAARDAAVAAARAKLWERSADLFAQAIRHETSADVPARLMGLRADRALALHLAGRASEAMAALSAAAEPMLADIKDEPSDPLLSTWMRVNEVAKMISGDLKGYAPMDPAAMSKVVGLCSTLEPFDWSSNAPAPSDVVALNLARVDLLARPVPELAIRLVDRLRDSRFLLVKSVAGSTLFDIAAATRDFGMVVADALEQLSAIDMVGTAAKGRDLLATYEAAAAPIPTDDRLEFVRVRVIAALFALAAAGKEKTAPFAIWRSRLPADIEYQSTRRLIDVAEQMLMQEDRPWDRLNPSPSAWEERLVIALAATRRQRLTPDQLLICHGIWVNFLRRPLLQDMSAGAVAALVTQDWLDRSESPAELVTPRVSVPAIRAAATSGTRGWSRIKAVLNAACEAVSHQSRSFARPLINAIEA